MFFLNANSGVPLYLQLQNQLKHRILSGEWIDGTQLPSVRDLSAQLRINMLTVSKAYKNLENEKFIVTRQGHGTFVAYSRPSLEPAAVAAKLEPAVTQLIAEARHLGLSKQQVLSLVSSKFNDL